MKKLLLLLLLISTPAYARDWYISNTVAGNSNSNPCTVAQPCTQVLGKLDGKDAISAGDNIFHKRGDEWHTEVVPRSKGTANAPINFDSYGTGANPVFTPVTTPITSGWVNAGGFVWTQTLGGGATVWAMGVDRDHALGQWYPNPASGMPAGTFKQSYGNPNQVWVRLFDSSDPNNHILYPARVNTSYGQRGWVRTYQLASDAEYITFNNMTVFNSADRGFTASGQHVTFNNCYANGCAMDGFHFQKDADENAQYAILSNSEASWNVGYSFFGGYGQGVTTYSPHTIVYKCKIHDNFMAGLDYLSFHESDDSDADSSYGYAGYNLIWNNGRGQDNGGSNGSTYDPNVYCDGCNHLLVFGNTIYGGGTESGSTNAKIGFAFGSEHPVSFPATDIDFINNISVGTHWSAVAGNNANTCAWDCSQCTNSCTTKPSNIKNVNIINNTLAAYTGGNDIVWDPAYHDNTASNWHFKNNIVISDGYPTGNWFGYGSYLDIDYNLYVRRNHGSSPITYQSSSANIYSTDGGTTNYTLATWKTFTGQEAHSIYGNPYVTTDSDTVFDAHLKRVSLGDPYTSPAIDAGQVNAYVPSAWTSWIPAQYLPSGGYVTGTTSLANTEDNYATAMDIGYHYATPPPVGPGNISGSVTPASLIKNTSTSLTVVITEDHDLAATGKAVVVIDPGFTINDGGATTASCGTGCTGSLTVSVASSTITATRSSGATITAGTQWTFTLTHIKTPVAAGTTSTYTLKTTDANDSVVDINSSIAASVITDPAAPPPAPTPNGLAGCKLAGVKIR